MEERIEEEEEEDASTHCPEGSLLLCLIIFPFLLSVPYPSFHM